MTDSSESTPNQPGGLSGAQRALIVLILLGAVATAWWALHRSAAPMPPIGPVTIGIPTQVNSAPMLVALDQGLFIQNGVKVVNQPFLLGKEALKSMLDGKADLAIVADTPFMHAFVGGKDVAIVAGITQARRSLAVVAHTNNGIQQVADLKGKTIGLTSGTNFPYFLESLLQTRGVDIKDLVVQDMKVDATVAAFKEGKLDAAVVFQPYLAKLQQALGNSVKVFYGNDVYAFRFLLVGKPHYIDTHPQEVQRVLMALAAATESIRQDPARARKAVGAAVKVDDALMSSLFTTEDYVLSLDQAMLLALEDQTRWAMKKGLIKEGPMPNYLNAMKFQPLEAIRPQAVKLAH